MKLIYREHGDFIVILKEYYWHRQKRYKVLNFIDKKETKGV